MRNTVREEDIQEILKRSEMKVATVYDKCTLVTVKLPNGFVLTESSACVDPQNYNEEVGVDSCLTKITDKLWELEGYRLQCELAERVEGEVTENA